MTEYEFTIRVPEEVEKWVEDASKKFGIGREPIVRLLVQKLINSQNWKTILEGDFLGDRIEVEI